MNANDLAHYLKGFACGRKNAKTAKVLLGTWLDEMDDRGIRRLAGEARELGFPVIGDSRGYFYAETRAEAEEAIARLESQGKAMLHSAAILKRILDRPGQGELFRRAE